MNRRLAGCCIASLLSITCFAAVRTDLPLVEAVKQGNKEAVRSLLNEHIDVNLPQPDGTTALAWAAERADLEMVELLIRAGATVNAANDYGATPLWLASTGGNAAIVEKLLNAGADSNLRLLSGETPLMAASEVGSTAAVKLLVEHGADVNAKETRGGQTALMWAVAERHADTAKVLIEHGAGLNTRSNRGYTALLFAAQEGDVESARTLLTAGADVNLGAENGTNPLLMASAGGQERMVSLLLDNKANPNAADRDGYTALHYAATGRNRLESVKNLLAHGANPNARLIKDASKGDLNATPVGATPFFLAASNRNIPVMRLLASSGADPLLPTSETLFLNAQNGFRLQVVANTTPLIAAAGADRVRNNYPEFTDDEEKNAIEAVKLALDLGADINAANDYGQTALHLATYLKADKLVRFLIENGAKTELFDKFGQTPLSIAARIITVGVKDSYDMSPRRDNESTVKVLLSMGATPLATSGVQVYHEPVK